jgi:hypothetical protein
MIDVSSGFADAEVAVFTRSRLILAKKFDEYCQSTKVKSVGNLVCIIRFIGLVDGSNLRKFENLYCSTSTSDIFKF